MEQKKQRQNWNVNFNNMAIGFLLALCLVLALGAATGGESQGPYQCSSGNDKAVFVIDTRTGQTWQLSRSDTFDLGTPFDRMSLRLSITPMVD